MRLRTLIISSLFYSVSELFGRLLQTGCLLYLARVSTKNEYGGVGLLFSVQQLVTFIAMGGLVEALTARLNQHREQGTVAELIALASRLLGIISLVVVVGYVVVAALLGQRLFPACSMTLKLVLLASGLLLATYTYVSNMLRLEEHHGPAILVKTAPLFLSYGGGLAGCFLATNKTEGFFLGCGVGLIACLPITVAAVARLGGGRQWLGMGVHWGAVRSLWRDALPYAIVALFAWMSGYGNNVAIKALFSEAEVAEYTMVCNFGFGILLVANAVSQVWAPRFLRLAAERDAAEVGTINVLVHQAQLYLIAMAAGTMLLFYRQVLALLRGNAGAYEGALPWLAIFLAAYVIFNLYYRSINYFMLHNQGVLFLKTVLWTSSVGTVVWVVLMKLLGVVGIYVGFFVLVLIRGAAVFAHARRHWGVHMGVFETTVALGTVACAYFLSAHAPGLWAGIGYTAVMALVVATFVVTNRRDLEKYVLARPSLTGSPVPKSGPAMPVGEKG